MQKTEIAKTASARNRLLLGVALFVVGFLVFSFQGASHKIFIRTVKQPLVAAVADTDLLRQQGLSGKSSLGRNEALLFIFESDGQPGIWMKDMRFPIDIVWVDPGKKVITVKQNILPSSYPEVFYPEGQARYVIEISGGRAAELGIAVGTVLKW